MNDKKIRREYLKLRKIIAGSDEPLTDSPTKALDITVEEVRELISNNVYFDHNGVGRRLGEIIIRMKNTRDVKEKIRLTELVTTYIVNRILKGKIEQNITNNLPSRLNSMDKELRRYYNVDADYGKLDSSPAWTTDMCYKSIKYMVQNDMLEIRPTRTIQPNDNTYKVKLKPNGTLYGTAGSPILLFKYKDVWLTDTKDRDVPFGDIAISVWFDDRCKVHHVKGIQYRNVHIQGYQLKAPHRLQVKDDYMHPHIKHNGIVCLGEALMPFKEALITGRLLDAYYIVDGVMRTYNDGDPYFNIETYCADNGSVPILGRSCHCGNTVTMYDSNLTNGAYKYVDTGSTQCIKCGEHYCSTCSKTAYLTCKKCGTSGCKECSTMTRCIGCNTMYCSNCVEEYKDVNGTCICPTCREKRATKYVCDMCGREHYQGKERTRLLKAQNRLTRKPYTVNNVVDADGNDIVLHFCSPTCYSGYSALGRCTTCMKYTVHSNRVMIGRHSLCRQCAEAWGEDELRLREEDKSITEALGLQTESNE